MLRDLQIGFRRTLLAAPDPALVAAVIGDGLAPEARLRVYRNHVAISLREALRSTFPVVCRLVGDDFFAGMARAFVAAHPPRSPCLFEYGDALPHFIADYAPAATLPYLADVADLEWALNAAYHAPLLPPLPAAALAATDPAILAEAPLMLQPSLRLIESPYPLEAIWRANQPGQDGSGVDLGAGGASLMVWRGDDDSVFQAIGPDASVFVAALLGGRTLAEAIEAGQTAEPGFEPGAGLALLLSAGLIAAPPASAAGAIR